MNKREAMIYTVGMIDGKFRANKGKETDYVCLRETFGKAYAKYDIGIINNEKCGVTYILFKNLGHCFDEKKPMVEIMSVSAKIPKERVYDLLLTALAIDKKYNL